MSPPRIPKKDRNRWLVVEGDDDKWVTIELLARHGSFWGDADREASTDLPYVHSANGIEPLRNLVAVEAKHKHRLRLGVILDADLEAGAAWSKLKDRLRHIDDPPEWLSPMLVQLPDALPREGLVVEQAERALGVWVMPDNGTRGTLEDFLVDLVPSGDIHWGPARENVAAAMQRGVQFPDQHRSKAEVHTWLAWQREPGVPLGRALKSAYFLHNSAGAMAFVGWFRRMFPAGE